MVFDRLMVSEGVGLIDMVKGLVVAIGEGLLVSEVDRVRLRETVSVGERVKLTETVGDIERVYGHEVGYGEGVGVTKCVRLTDTV